MPRVYFLHGCLGQPSSWDEVRRRLGRDDDSVALRLPGHGPHPSGDPLPSSFDAAADALLAELPAEPVVLCGYSMGARVALSIAARAPARIARAVLVGCHPGLDDEGERVARMAWDREQAALVEREGLSGLVDAWERMPVFASQRALPAGVLARQREERLDHTPAGIAAALRLLGLGNMPSRWSDLATAAPTDWIAGGRDAKFRSIADRAATAASGARVRIAPDVGHNVGLEAPEWLAEQLAHCRAEAAR